MFIYIYLLTFVYIYSCLCIFAHNYIYVHVCLYLLMLDYIWSCMYIYFLVCIYFCLYMFALLTMCCMTTLFLHNCMFDCLCGIHIYSLISDSLVLVNLISLDLIFDMRLIALFVFRPRYWLGVGFSCGLYVYLRAFGEHRHIIVTWIPILEDLYNPWLDSGHLCD